MTNRMGGIVRIEIAPTDSFDSITCTRGRCALKMKTGRDWLSLNILQHQPTDSDDTATEDAGTLTTHSLAVPFYPDDETLLTRVFSMASTGFIARITFASGDVRILGTLRYPAYGSCLRQSGQQPSDPYHYELSCQCHTQMRRPL